jgi:hypothetical protein
MANGECPIILWEHDDDEDQAAHVVTESLESWLTKEPNAEFGDEVSS